MRNLSRFCHYHRGDKKEKAIKILGSFFGATAIFLWSSSVLAGVIVQQDIDLIAKFIPEPGYLSMTAVAQESFELKQSVPEKIEAQLISEFNGNDEEREKFEKERQTQELNRWKNDRLRESKNVLRELGKLRSQIARLKGTSESLNKLDAVKSGLIEFINKVGATQDTDELRDLLENTDFSDWWEEINLLRAAIEIPRDLNNIRRDQKRALITLKQKWVCKIIDCVKFNPVIQAMNNALDEATRFYKEGELEDARNAVQEIFHEKGWYGDALGALQMMRGFTDPLRRIRNKELNTQLLELIDPVKELLYEGDVREARESMDAIQRELGPSLFKLIMDAENKRRAVPEKVFDKIEQMRERLEQVSPQKEVAPQEVQPISAIPATSFPGEEIPAIPATPAQPSPQLTQPTVSATKIIIKGRLIDRASKQSLSNIYIKTDGLPASLSSGLNGEFSFVIDAGAMTPLTPKSFSFWPNCHIGRGGRIDKDASGNIKILVDVFDLVNGYTNYTFSPSGSEVNLGDLPQWPAVDLNLTSDVPVKFTVEYPEEGQSAGNSLFKTSHTLSRVIPLDYKAQVKLTDQSGNIFYSPPVVYPLSQGCNASILIFTGGEYKWSMEQF